MTRLILNILLLILSLSSCRNNNLEEGSIQSDSNSKISKINKIQLYNFIGDSLLTNHGKYINEYIAIYMMDTCEIQVRTYSQLQNQFKGVNPIGDVNNDKILDSVFVLNTFTMCDAGDTYCFTSKSLPPLKTESECCHPSSLFICPDINEDNIFEIGIYYSSCVSRFKSLRIFSLKNKKWKEIGISDFDIGTKDPSTVDLKSLVKKISKNQYSICNFLEGRTYWDTINLNLMYYTEIMKHNFFCDTLEQTQYGDNLCSITRANYSDSILKIVFETYYNQKRDSNEELKWEKKRNLEINNFIKECDNQPYCIKELNDNIYKRNVEKIKEMEVKISNIVH